MRRWILLLILAADAGCVQYGALAGAAALGLAPGMAGLAAAREGDGDGYMEMNYAHVRGDETADGGWGLGIRSAGVGGDGPQAYYVQGQVEVGRFGRDRIYGFASASFGTGLQLRPGVAVVGAMGYRYGGYPQIGHTFPARAAIYAAVGKLVFHGGVFAGWRVGERDEWPEGTSFGPGWQSWGADASLVFAGDGGIAIGVGYDHEDNIDIVTIRVGAAMHPAAQEAW